MIFEQLLLTQVLQISVLVLIVWAITRFVTQRHAHLSHLLWIVVLLKCVTPPIWSSHLGMFSWATVANTQMAMTDQQHGNQTPEERSADYELSSASFGEDGQPPGQINEAILSELPNLIDDEATLVMEANRDDQAPITLEEPAADSPVPNARLDSDLDALLRAELASIPPNTETTNSSEEHSKLTVPVERPALTNLSASTWLMLGWLSVAAAILLLTLARAARCVGELKNAAVDADSLQQTTDHLAARLRLQRPVKLLVTSCAVGPAVVGLVRPWIVLPDFVVQRSSQKELESILAHELIHIRRGDLWIGLLRHFARSLWWFHPLVWKSSVAVRKNAERCCDEEVIASLGIPAAEYARSLLSVLELKQQLKAIPVVPGVRPFDITSRRLEEIMMLGQGSRQQTPRWCWAVAIVFAIVSLPGAGLMLGQTQSESSSASGAAPATNTADETNAATQASAATQATPATRATLPPIGEERVVGSAIPTGSFRPNLVKLDCVFMTASAEEAKNLNVDWRQVSSAGAADNRIQNFDPYALPGGANSPFSESRMVVEKRMPVLRAVLPQDRVVQLRRQLEKQRVLSRPKVITRNDAPATIEVGWQRDFVVGVGDGGKPEKQTFHFGVSGDLRPVVKENEIQLRYRLSFKSLRAVETFNVKTADGQPLAIQFPEIERSVVTSLEDIPNGHWLLVQVRINKPGSDEELMLALIKPVGMVEDAVANRVASQPGTQSGPGATTTAGEAAVPRQPFEYESIPWGLLQREPTGEHVLAPGDVLGVYIVGVLGGENQIPPVRLPTASNQPPSLGYPIPIRQDGTIPLPMIDDPMVAGLTIPEAEKKVSDAYTVDRKLLHKGSPIILSVMRPAHIRVLVFRQDTGDALQSFRSAAQRPVTGNSNGFDLALPASQADILTALAMTGGLPGDDAQEILVYRHGDERTTQRIPLFYPKGKTIELSDEDVTLHEGDIVVVKPAGSKTSRAAGTLQGTLPGAASFAPKAASRSSTALANPMTNPATASASTSEASTATDISYPPLAPPTQNMETNPAFESYTPVAATSQIPPHEDDIERVEWRLTLDECVSMMMNSRTTTKAGWRLVTPAGGPQETSFAKALTKDRHLLFPTNADVPLTEAKQQINSQLLTLIGAYWQLAAKQTGVTEHSEAVTSSHRMWQRVRMRHAHQIEGGEAALEARSRAQYFSFKSGLETATRQRDLAEQQLRRLLSLAENDGRLIRAVDSAHHDDFEPDHETVTKAALVQDDYLAKLRKREIQQQKLVDAGYRSGVAELRRALDKMQRLRKSITDAEFVVMHKVSSAIRQHRDARRITLTHYNTLRAYRDQVTASEAAYKVAQTVPLDLVLDAQSRRLQAALDYANAARELKAATSRILAVRGTLLQEFGYVLSSVARNPRIGVPRSINGILPDHKSREKRFNSVS